MATQLRKYLDKYEYDAFSLNVLNTTPFAATEYDDHAEVLAKCRVFAALRITGKNI